MHSVQRILFFSVVLRLIRVDSFSFFYGNNFFNVGQKRDHNFSPSSGVLYAAAAAGVSEIFCFSVSGNICYVASQTVNS